MVVIDKTNLRKSFKKVAIRALVLDEVFDRRIKFQNRGYGGPIITDFLSPGKQWQRDRGNVEYWIPLV